MEKLAHFVVTHRRKIGIFFLVFFVISLLLIPRVKINYDLSKYIPNTFPSKDALDVVEEEFGMQSIARVMVNDVTLPQAKEYKNQIEAVDGVDMVVWLDDDYDVYQPESFIDEEDLAKYYKDGSALFEVMFEEDDYSLKTNKAIEEIWSIIPEDSNMMGSGLDTKSAQDSLSSEMVTIMLFLVPLAIVILLLTTDSWTSPLLFITVIATSIVYNFGTNVIFDSVSFLTFSISAALQFAVSMDYSVFMLHQFESEKKKTDDVAVAMKNALKNSITSILSSSLTTIVGFIALAFMDFGIGKDIGFVFSKGIVFSLLCVIFLMPYLILRFDKLIEKTRHKAFLPTFEKFSANIGRFKYLIIVIVLLIAVPSFVAQKQNQFLYGVSAFGSGEGTKANLDEKAIVEKFGRSNPMVLLIPKGDYVKQKEMVGEIENMNAVSKVQALVANVPEGIPYSFIDQELYRKFESDNYTRIIIYSKTSSESDLATETYNEIVEIAEKYYDENYKLTGTIPVTIDMKNVIESDYNRVNMVSILAIAVILLFTFRSFTVSILLVIVIELGIFINMAMPYYQDTSLIFMGYLIVSSIELGATIDYAILVTNNYLEARKTKEAKESAKETLMKSIPAILTSGGILISAGYIIKFFSSISAISEIGELIGRGALISVILVVFLLPQLLVLFDKMIFKKHLIARIKQRIEILKKKRKRK
ncbi:MAG: MMPL family transporter [Clostridia bacterium]|nr:MMPL family transporter [Clostridia bacterium]